GGTVASLGRSSGWRSPRSAERAARTHEPSRPGLRAPGSRALVSKSQCPSPRRSIVTSEGGRIRPRGGGCDEPPFAVGPLIRAALRGARPLLPALRRKMADYPVVGDVSETLRSVINAGLSSLVPPPTVEVHDLQGVIPTAPAHVTICLYDVIEDPSA